MKDDKKKIIDKYRDKLPFYTFTNKHDKSYTYATKGFYGAVNENEVI